jgi:hypothetical protein
MGATSLAADSFHKRRLLEAIQLRKVVVTYRTGGFARAARLIQINACLALS